ncbi:Mediator of RNA polymerase II transcription subunit 16 [Glycine max]|nr:Mediator of RNA polymerase II transcription subunit 16 [Glycine max]
MVDSLRICWCKIEIISTGNPPFWIPIHIVIPERPTECAVFNVIADTDISVLSTPVGGFTMKVALYVFTDSPRDSVQFIEWSPTCCPHALLIANFHGRVTIWTQPSQICFSCLFVSDFLSIPGQANLALDASCWLREHEWQQDIAVVTKWLSGYRWLSSKPSAPANSRSTFEEKFLSRQCQTSVQLLQYWPPQNATTPKWFCTSKGSLGCGPCGIMAGDAIITDSGTMLVTGVPIVNPSTIVVWEVMPGPGNGFQVIPRTSTNNGVPLPLSSPNWTGFAPLAAYLFSWQDYLLSEEKQGKNQNLGDSIPLNCSPVSNFSAYVSPETAAQSAATTTWGSGVTAVAFDPTCGGSVIAVVIVEALRLDSPEFLHLTAEKGGYMSPYDPDEGPSITGWRVQRWESSLQHDVLHPIFGNPTSSMGGQPPMQTVWQTKVELSIPPTNDFKNHQAPAVGMNTDMQKISVGSAIAAPAFSSTSCCSASVWHDTSKDQTILKIIRVLPRAIPTSQVKANSSNWERAIAERKSRFWWSLLVGVNWWDAVGCTQSAAEDGIVSLNSVIAVLDADFHSLPSAQHRQHYCPILSQLVPASKGGEEPSPGRSRIGTGNAGQGYTYGERLTVNLWSYYTGNAGLQHPLPVSQVGSNNIQVRLHYIDGNYTVLPEVVEAALGPHMQNMPRPRGADAAGLLLCELELHPPAEEWHRRNMFGGPWSDPDVLDSANDALKLVSLNPLDSSSLENCDVYYGANGLWSR